MFQQWMKKNLLKLLFPLLILIIICMAYGELITAPREVLFGESLVYWGYQNEFIKESLLKYGQLGLWDNQNGLGYSLIGNQSAHFYPLTWTILLITDPLLSIRFLGFMHLLLGGLAFFYLMRVLKCNTFSSFFASIIFIVNPYVINLITTGLFAEIYNLVWMPLSFAFLWKALFYKERVYAIFAGISLAMQIFSMSALGFTFTLILLIFLLFFKLLNSILVEKQKLIDSLKEIFIVSFILFGTALGISAIKLFPILEFKSLSSRNEVTLYGRDWGIQQPEFIFQYLKTRIVNLSSLNIYEKISNYLFLFIIAISILSRKKIMVFFLIISIISLWASLAYRLKPDLYAIFYYIFPFIRFNETPTRFLILTNLSLPILAGISVNLLTKLRVLKIDILIVLILLYFVLQQSIAFARSEMKNFVKNIPVSKSIQGTEANDFNKNLGKLVKKEKEIVKVSSFYIGGENVVFDYSALVNNFRLINPFYSDFVPTYQYFYLSSLPDQEYKRKKYKLLNLMNVKYVVAQKDYDDYPNDYVNLLIKRSDGAIYENKSFLPFAGSISNGILLIGDNKYKDFNAFKAKVLILNKEFDLEKFTVFTTDSYLKDIELNELKKFDAIILTNNNDDQRNKLQEYKKNGGQVLDLKFNEKKYKDIRGRSASIFYDNPAEFLSQKEQEKYITLLSNIEAKSKMRKNQVNLIRSTPELIEISLIINNPRNFIQISETYFPGWNAYVDEKKVSIYMADGLVKGITIEKKGKHSLILKYEPLSFKIGVTITTLTIVFLSILFRKKKLFKL